MKEFWIWIPKLSSKEVVPRIKIMDIYHTMTQEVSSQLKKNILLCQKESGKKEQEEKKKRVEKNDKKESKNVFR